MPYLLLAFLLVPFTTALAQLEVSNGWIRQFAPNSRVTAGYVVLHNPTVTPYTITGASSTAAERVELHTHIMADNGLMEMRPMASVTLDPHDEVIFAPGGRHFMFYDPTRTMEVGREADLKLHFSDGNFQTIRLLVQPISYLPKRLESTPGQTLPDNQHTHYDHHHGHP